MADGSPDVVFIKNLIDEKMVPEEVKFSKDPFCMGLDIKAANENGTGAKVTSVEAGSEAAAKGVRVGLPIVEINGRSSWGYNERQISERYFEQLPAYAITSYTAPSIRARITSGTNYDDNVFTSLTFGGSKYNDLAAFWKNFDWKTFVKDERLNLKIYQNAHKQRKNSFQLHVAHNKERLKRLATEEAARKEREQKWKEQAEEAALSAAAAEREFQEQMAEIRARRAREAKSDQALKYVFGKGGDFWKRNKKATKK